MANCLIQVIFPLVVGVLCVQASVRWYSIGDWGDYWFSFQHRVADSMAEYARDFQPEFILALGDNFYQEGIHSVNDSKIDLVWRYTYNHTELKDLHWWLALGNHDYGLGFGEEWVQVELTSVEPRWHVPYLWHEFVKTDGETTVDFIVIDTQALREQVNNYTVMMAWLDERLEAATADWVFVCAHHPIFSCGDKGPVSGTFYNELLPVLDKHRGKLDVYLTGHDHNVQLLQKIDDPGYFDFIISGAAGALFYAEDPTCADILRDDYNISKTFMDVTGAFTAVTASPDSLYFEFVDYNDTVLHTYTRFKTPAGEVPGSLL